MEVAGRRLAVKKRSRLASLAPSSHYILYAGQAERVTELGGFLHEANHQCSCYAIKSLLSFLFAIDHIFIFSPVTMRVLLNEFALDLWTQIEISLFRQNIEPSSIYTQVSRSLRSQQSYEEGAWCLVACCQVVCRLDKCKNAVSRCRNEKREFVFLCTVARNMRAIWVFMVHFCEKIASEQPVFFSGL